MKKTVVLIAVLLLLAPGVPAVQAGWKDVLDTITEGDSPAKGLTSGALTQSEMAAGLRQALKQGIRNAVDSLGRPDGFMGNPEVRIPMPDKLRTVEKAARALGRDELADEFILSMNRAGEKAVPETLDILTSAAGNMTLEDARSILNGPEDAATRYFERTSRQDLARRIEPIVAESTKRVGATARYKDLTAKAAPLSAITGGQSLLDLDRYVTGRSLDGLFLLMAREEKRIRENPAARTTELLQKVFGR